MNDNRDGTSADSSLLHCALEEKRRQQLLDVLEDPIRRLVLDNLDPDEGWVSLAELSERVGERHVRGAAPDQCQPSDEGDFADRTSPDRSSADRTPADATPVDRVALRLHHVHLPKLADYGIVEYDHRERTVRATVC